MAKGAFGLMKMALNLVLLVAILVGAYIGYLKFFAGDEVAAKQQQAVLTHVDAKEWQLAIDELEKLKDEKGLKDFVKEQGFTCNKALAHEENDAGMEAERDASKYKSKNAEKSADYKKRATKHFKKVIKCLKQADKLGELKYVDVMMLPSAYKFIGDDENSKKWMKKQRDYPKE